MAVTNPIQLHESKHPDKAAQQRYDGLVGIDTQKRDIVDYITRVLDTGRIDKWLKKHHGGQLKLAERITNKPPFVILAGDVGCGKTALANSVATPIAEKIDTQVLCLETPSDIRGGGHVGELSERITAAFTEARTRAGRNPAILVIDEGDDLGTSRTQMQAHHEDRAGVNVLIKEIDRVAKDNLRLVVVLVTNRFTALDPAVVRRAHVVIFERPNAEARRALFEQLLVGTRHDKKNIDALVKASSKSPAFSYSDLVERGAEAAILRCIREDRAFSVDVLLHVINDLEPSPMFEDKKV